MNYDTLGSIVIAGADRAEETLPFLSFRELLDKLEYFTDLGIIAEGSLPMMLIVARLVDRRRVLQSGLTSTEVERALVRYRAHGKTVQIMEDALDQTVRMLRYAENARDNQY